MNFSRPWYRWGVLVYDRGYRLLHHLDTPASEVRPALRIEIRRCGRAKTLPDGTRLSRGDPIGVIHLNNARIAALHQDGLRPSAVGLEFRRQLLASLGALAALASPGRPLAAVPAFVATTIFHQLLARLGFEPESDGRVWPRLVAVYQRALLASVHPAGSIRLRRSTYRRARRLWLSRTTLLARYGDAQVDRCPVRDPPDVKPMALEWDGLVILNAPL